MTEEQKHPTYQAEVQAWLLACFGPKNMADVEGRGHRFLEEALELVQSLGVTRASAYLLIDYVFDRPAGEPKQEVGGVEVTLAALCVAAGIDKNLAARTELDRVWTKIPQIRAKDARKPDFSPLPGTSEAA